MHILLNKSLRTTDKKIILQKNNLFEVLRENSLDYQISIENKIYFIYKQDVTIANENDPNIKRRILMLQMKYEEE